ncbi:MAG: response regulator [bacterium]
MNAFEGDKPNTTRIEYAEGNSADAKTLLVIDDDESVLKVNVRILRQLGYAVYSSSSGPAAVKMYKEQQKEIAAVLSDMIMPEMSGLDVHKELVKINPEVKFIIVSGYSNNIKKDVLKALGVNAYISKPFAINELNNTVRKVLDT